MCACVRVSSFVFLYMYARERRFARCAHVCVPTSTHISDLAPSFFSQFLFSGVHSASCRFAISSKWISSSLSLEGNLVRHILSLSCSQICTPYDSEEHVRIIPRKRIELSMARARYSKAKNIPDGTGYPSPYRKSMRNKEHIPRILAAARRGKDFPYESIT